MSDVEFEDKYSGNRGSILYSRFERTEKKPGMVEWLLKKNIAKSESQANFILLILVAVLILLTFYLIFFSHNPTRGIPKNLNIVNINGQPPRLLNPIYK